MKKKNIRTIQLFLICLFVPIVMIKAQNNGNIYLNVDWQLNAPIGNSFANKVSGWGAHGEIGYFVMPNFAIGGFLSFHSNNKYIDRQTFPISETSVITSDQQHSIFQLPFGLTSRYVISNYSVFEPYVGLKLGTNYSEVSSYLNIFKTYERKWGFFISPEIGMTVQAFNKLGVHIAAYYNYSTNKSKVLGYSVDGLNNVGMRLGIAF